MFCFYGTYYLHNTHRFDELNLHKFVVQVVDKLPTLPVQTAVEFEYLKG